MLTVFTQSKDVMLSLRLAVHLARARTSRKTVQAKLLRPATNSEQLRNESP
jgi:hypothetical protein